MFFFSVFLLGHIQLQQGGGGCRGSMADDVPAKNVFGLGRDPAVLERMLMHDLQREGLHASEWVTVKCF